MKPLLPLLFLPAILIATPAPADEKPDGKTKEAESKEPPPASEPALPPELARQFGELLLRDWKDRPEWADMAAALLKGEPMRPGMGWWRPGEKHYGWDWLQERFDADGDGNVLPDELPSEFPKAQECFARLDRDRDGKVTEDDFDWSRRAKFLRDGSMANELFHRLDSDSNGRITQSEYLDFFVQAGQDGLGYLTQEDFRNALEDPPNQKSEQPASPPPPPDPAEDLRMLFSGEFGWLEAGPALGEPAPDFTLPTHDGKATVTLSEVLGNKPVVLVFGSFT